MYSILCALCWITYKNCIYLAMVHIVCGHLTGWMSFISFDALQVLLLHLYINSVRPLFVALRISQCGGRLNPWVWEEQLKSAQLKVLYFRDRFYHHVTREIKTHNVFSAAIWWESNKLCCLGAELKALFPVCTLQW